MRTKLYIKPHLQLPHLIWTAIIISLSCLLGYFVFESITKSIILSQPEAIGLWTQIQSALRWGFATVYTVLLIFICIENFLVFHAIVGPIYALEKAFHRLSHGEMDDKFTLRNYDSLEDIVGPFEDMRLKLRAKFEQQQETITSLEAELEKFASELSPQKITALRKRLKQLKDQAEKKAA